MHDNSKQLFQRYAVDHFREGDKVLEIGPENHDNPTYLALLNAKVDWWFGDRMNYRPDHPNFVRFLDDYHIDCPDETFDVVFHGQVIEHVERIWIWVKETARVLKMGGKMIIINPCFWPYHIGEGFQDCWRIFPPGMRVLMEDSGIRCDFSEFLLLSQRTDYPENQPDTISIGVRVK